MVAAIAGTVSAVSAIGGTIAQGQAAQDAADQANANAAAQNKYTDDVYAIKVNYQHALQNYQPDVWKTDLDFATKTLTYQEGEEARQQTFVNSEGNNIVTNINAEIGQEMLKSVQENVATSLQEAGVQQRTSQGIGTAQTNADAAGVTGNTVSAIIQNVQKQGGDAMNVLEMNRSAATQQARVDLEAVNAQGDSQLSALGGDIKTYAPDTQVRAPAPLEPVVRGPMQGGVASRSILGTVFGVVGDLAGGVTKIAGTSGGADFLSGLF